MEKAGPGKEIRIMSQKKVDHYKKEKANRKQVLERQKRNKKIAKVMTIIFCVLIIGSIATAIGVTVYNEAVEYIASLPDYSSDSLVVSDMVGILDLEEEDEDTDDEDTDDADEADETEEASDEETETEETDA